MTRSIQWRPTAPLSVLKKRADVFYQIRDFFRNKNVLEVDTPILGFSGVSDPYINNLATRFSVGSCAIRYLQTSPEYAMKRLLAAGSGSIYQLGKVFRDELAGSQHQPEFTMLEWYRIGWSVEELIDEVKALITLILGEQQWSTVNYQSLFIKVLNINPHSATIHDLQKIAFQKINHTLQLPDKNQWLDLLFSHCIEPELKKMGSVIVTEYPASQAALAKTFQNKHGECVSKRFEVYINGVELANGYQELQDVIEQQNRFMEDQQKRRVLHLPEAVIDEQLLAAMEAGLPECSGVALGVDRLIMLCVGAQHIAQVISFGDQGSSHE